MMNMILKLVVLYMSLSLFTNGIADIILDGEEKKYYWLNGVISFIMLGVLLVLI